MERELLLVDYDKSLAAVDKFDGALLQIHNWALATCGAVTAYGFSQRSALILVLGSLLAVLFGTFALVFKAFQIDAMNHVSQIERMLNEPSAKVENYAFGVGRAISGATWPAMKRSFLLRALWYIHAFFLILAAAPLVALLAL